MQNEIIDSEEAAPKPECLNCGSTFIEPNHVNPLCADCRQIFLKFPTPKWVMAFAAVIGVILLFSLISLPKNIALGLKLQKGKDAVEAHHYLTAKSELQAFAKEVPESEEGNAYLLMTDFYNMDYEQMYTVYKRLENKKISDDALHARLTNILVSADDYFPSDSLNAFFEKNQNDSADVLESALVEYIKSNPKEIYASAAYGSIIMNKENYVKADSIYNTILQTTSDYMPALYAMTSIKRMENKPEESMKYCDQILEINNQSVYGLSTKARTLLKQSKDKEALAFAKECEMLSPDDAYNTATLAMAYHFNKMNTERDALVKKMTSPKDSANTATYQYALDVLNNKESFR